MKGPISCEQKAPPGRTIDPWRVTCIYTSSSRPCCLALGPVRTLGLLLSSWAPRSTEIITPAGGGQVSGARCSGPADHGGPRYHRPHLARPMATRSVIGCRRRRWSRRPPFRQAPPRGGLALRSAAAGDAAAAAAAPTVAERPSVEPGDPGQLRRRKYRAARVGEPQGATRAREGAVDSRRSTTQRAAC